MVREALEETVPPFLGLRPELFGDLHGLPGLAHPFRPTQTLHLDEIDHPDEGGLDAPGKLDHQGGGVQTVFDHLDGPLEVGSHPVHLVHEADPGDVVAVGLTPHGLALGLHARHRIEDRHRAVEHTERPLDLHGEVHVAGGVDDVDPVVPPQAGRGRRGDGDAALALLDHPVHLGGALVDLSDLVGLARVVQDPLGRGGLARVDVGHDPDVPSADERVFQDHQGLAGPSGSLHRFPCRLCHRIQLPRRGGHRCYHR